MKINELERKCLEVLVDYYHSEENCLYFRAFEKYIKFDVKHIQDIKHVRRLVRSLARKGLALYVKGLFSEEGITAGSGYRATQEGYDLITKGDKNEN